MTREAKYIIFLAILSCMAFVFVLAITGRYGPGVSPDSVSYISAARSFAAEGTYIDLDGMNFERWPPLFPTVLGLFRLVGVGVIQGARFLNAFVFAVTVFLIGFWGLKRFRYRPFALFTAAAIFVAEPVLWPSLYVWSEPLFVLLCVLSVFGVISYLEKGRARYLFLSILSVSMSVLTRYAGIGVIASLGLCILVAKRRDFVKGLAAGAMFCIVSFVPLLLWFIRNLISSGQTAGWRGKGQSPFTENLELIGREASNWILPEKTPLLASFLIVYFVLTLLVVAAGRHRMILDDLKALFRSPRSRPLLFFALGYVIFLLLSSAYSWVPINLRLMSPAYWSFLLLAIFALDRLIQSAPAGGRKKIVVSAVVLLIGIWTSFIAVRTGLTAWNTTSKGIEGFNSPAWTGLQTISYLRENPSLGHHVYSNLPEAVHYLTGLRASRSHHPGFDETDIAVFNAAAQSEKGVLLVWFKNQNMPYLYSVKDIERIYDVNIVADFPDGSVYMITAKGE
ncbi:MAG: hypothetical protein ACYS8W_05080 [Planctomycetota bacterium]|jgi:hypothetical protein